MGPPCASQLIVVVFADTKRDCGETCLERLDCAVPDYIGAQARSRAADDNVIINSDGLCPQDLTLLGTLIGVVLETNGRGSAVVARVGAEAAHIATVPAPIGRNQAVAFWTSGDSGGSGAWLITLGL